MKGCVILTAHNSKIEDVENKIIELLNDNKLTNDEFDQIINDLIFQKNNAYLIFEKISKDNLSCNELTTAYFSSGNNSISNSKSGNQNTIYNYLWSKA